MGFTRGKVRHRKAKWLTQRAIVSQRQRNDQKARLPPTPAEFSPLGGETALLTTVPVSTFTAQADLAS